MATQTSAARFSALSITQLGDAARHWERKAAYHADYENQRDLDWYAEAVANARLYRAEIALRSAPVVIQPASAARTDRMLEALGLPRTIAGDVLDADLTREAA